MLFAIAIDNTIGIEPEQFRQAMRCTMALGVSKQTTSELQTYCKLLALRARQVQQPEPEDQHRPANIDQLVPLPHAVDGCRALAEQGTLVYMTSRSAREAAAIRAWLKHHKFPNAEQTYHCRMLAERYTAVRMLADKQERIVGIGSRLEKAIGAFQALCRVQPRMAYELIGRIELVGLGYNEHPCRYSPLSVSILPSWRQADFEAWLSRHHA